MTVSSKLSGLSKMWKKVKPAAPSFVNVPEGEYVADLKELKLTEAKKSGRVQVESTYAIADGDYEGKTVKRFDGLDNETSMGYFKGYAEIIGLDIPEDLELLQEAMDEFVANNNDLFNIVIKVNGEYSNVYVNGASEYTKGGEEQEETTEEEATEEVEEEAEEAEEEEVAEEEEEVEVVAPKKAMKPVTKTVTPMKKAATVALPAVKKIVSLKRK